MCLIHGLVLVYGHLSTMGWPKDTAELKQWYPTSVLVTGYDIIFFWVARMIFMALEFEHEIPFKHVFYSWSCT